MDILDKKRGIEAGKELAESKIEEAPKEEHFEERESLPEKLPSREAETKETLEEIEKIKLTPELKKEAGEEAVKIKGLDNEGRVSRLLALAKEKGLVFAVDVAKKTGDAYLLDSLHDSLVKEGRFREFEK